MASVIPFFLDLLNRSMNTEQFEWLDRNPDQEDWSGCSVRLVEDKIYLALDLLDQNIIGVVASSLDNDPAWATVQTQGRASVYKQSAKSSNWIYLKSFDKVGPRGPLDEYFIR